MTDAMKIPSPDGGAPVRYAEGLAGSQPLPDTRMLAKVRTEMSLPVLAYT